MQRAWRIYRKASRIGWTLVYGAALVSAPLQHGGPEAGPYVAAAVALTGYTVARHIGSGRQKRS